MRIDKYLCEMGTGSRKEIKKFIKEKKVSVNGKCVLKADFCVDENKDEVIFDGRKVLYQKYIYLMLNKPAGYLSATEDKRLPTVRELTDEKYAHYNVFCAGRLDIDTTGFLLLTNDGDFAHHIISPRHHIEKKYFAKINAPADESDVCKMKEGIVLDDGYKCMSAKLEIINSSPEGSEIYLTIQEGKFHQVKRMFEAVGKKVLSLKRVEIGGVLLDESLKPGQMRELTKEEANRLGVRD